MTASSAAPLITASQLAARIGELAGEIKRHYAVRSGAGEIVIVSVLKGSLPFVADLVRALADVGVVLDFLAISAYEPDSGRVRLVKDLDIDLAGRDVLLVEDIVDTGLTLGFLLGELGRRDPSSLEVCALLDKTARRILPTPIAFRGFEVSDVFVLGYGLDFAGRYRNLDHIVAGDIEVLTEDPDAYVAQLYGNEPPDPDD